MAISLKVSVAHLIANAEQQREQIVAEHAGRVATYELELVTLRKQGSARLRDMAAKVAAGKADDEFSIGWSGRRAERPVSIEIEIGTVASDAPTEKPNTRAVDRALKVLRATSQEEVTVREDSDLAVYL